MHACCFKVVLSTYTRVLYINNVKTGGSRNGYTE